MTNFKDKHAGTKKLLRRCFKKPTVEEVDWEKASDPKRYNCFGFAVGVLKWWQHYRRDRSGVIENPRDYWPAGLPSNDSIEAYVKAAELNGFHMCDPGWEPGFEKIMLFFIDNGEEQSFTHASRQVSLGRWQSKLGTESDIEHSEDIDCLWYGAGRIYMKRGRLI